MFTSARKCVYLFVFQQQWRLIPYVAAVFALDNYFKTSFVDYFRMQLDVMFGANGERIVSDCFY